MSGANADKGMNGAYADKGMCGANADKGLSGANTDKGLSGLFAQSELKERRPIRLGMIGAGHVSGRYLEQAAQLEGVRFVAVCSRQLHNAERKAAQYGVPRWYDDYHVMLDQDELDAVVVTTPHSAHAEPVLAALERGLHVLNEKPMATSFDDCRHMVELAEARGGIFMSLPYDLNRAVLAAAAFLHEHENGFGPFTGAEAHLSLPGPWRDNWYYNRSIAQGGAMLDCMVYPVSRLITLLGPAVSVMAEAGTLIPHRIVGDGKRVLSDVDDNVTLLLTFAGGQQAVIRSLWGLSFKLNHMLLYARHGTLALNDSGFPLVVHSPGRLIADAAPVVWRGQSDCYAPQALLAAMPQESVIAHFVRCLRAGEPPLQSARQQLHVHEILFGAYRSAETGQRVTLTTTFDPRPPFARGQEFYDTRSRYL